MSKKLLLMMFLLCPCVARAQASAIHLDVISIKENRSGEDPGYLTIPPKGARIMARNVPMFRLIHFAFNKQRNDVIDGLPEWTRTARWDIDATIAEESIAAFQAMSDEQKREVLQQILALRCSFEAHLGMKEVPVYALTIAKSGLKMREEPSPPTTGPAPPSVEWDFKQGPGMIHGRNLSMQGFMYALSKAGLERPVIDRTALKGAYNIDLRWSADDNAADARDSTEASPPSMFTAIQEQLGLKLDPVRAQVEAVIVTHIERPAIN